MRFNVGGYLARLLGLWAAASGVHAEVLRAHDDGPLQGLFGFPDPIESADIEAAGRYRYAINISTASHNVVESRGNESLTLDGETSRVAMNTSWGIADRIELGIEVPYVWHHSGNLDGVIDDWHDFFGLPEGPRATRAQDLLDLAYSDAEGNSIRLNGNVHGIGDMRLLAGWRLRETPTHRFALRVGLKLPTGDSAKLLGSGGTDLSVGVAGDVDGIGDAQKLSVFYRADIVYLGTPDVLAGRARDVVGQVAGGVGYRAWRSVDLRIQARIRSAVYESALESLGQASVTLTTGAIVSLGDRLSLVLGFGEDIKPASAPDISFQLALRYR